MKDRSLNVEEKNRRLEKVKLKYANVEPSDVQAALDLVGVYASSFSQKPKQQEQPNLMVNAVKETRLNAESKAMGDTNKAAKVEKESAMQ